MKIKGLFLFLGLCPAIWSMSKVEMQRFIKISPAQYTEEAISRYGDAIPYHLYLGFVQHVRCFENINTTECEPRLIRDDAICLDRHVRSLVLGRQAFSVWECKKHIKAILAAHGLTKFIELCDNPDIPLLVWATQVWGS